MKTSRGVTAIELLLALAITSAIILISIPKARDHMQNAELETLRTNADHVMSALNGYFERYCSSGATPTPTVPVLVSNGFLQSANYARNPFGANLQPVVLWGTPTMLEVRATVTRGNAASIMSIVGADRVSGSVLYWTRAPRVRSHGSSDAMKMKAMYQPDTCR